MEGEKSWTVRFFSRGDFSLAGESAHLRSGSACAPASVCTRSGEVLIVAGVQAGRAGKEGTSRSGRQCPG